MSYARLGVLVLLVSLAAAPAPAEAQSVAVPNPSFETGGDAPDGWTLSGGKGATIPVRPGSPLAIARGSRGLTV